MVEARGVGLRLMVVLGLLAGASCGSEAPGKPAAQPPEDEADAGPAAKPADSGPSNPKPAADSAALVPDVAASDGGSAPPPPADAAVADVVASPAPDTGAPLGEFPLATVRAARPEKLVSVATPCEGPSWIDGEVFFGFR